MKKIKCDLCDHVAEGETSEEWVDALKPHYIEAHAEVMQSKKGTSEEMRTEMMKWMVENKARFDAVK